MSLVCASSKTLGFSNLWRVSSLLEYISWTEIIVACEHTYRAQSNKKELRFADASFSGSLDNIPCGQSLD
jgi:hypothetical protein